MIHVSASKNPNASYISFQSWTVLNFISVQFSHSVMSDSLCPCGLQRARSPCPSPTPGVYSNSCPLSQWCHPSHPLSSPSPPAFNLSQHQGLFKWVSSLHQMDKVLEFQLQYQSFQWIWIGLPGLLSLQSKGLSTAFSKITVQKHQFFSAQLSL